MESLPDEGPGLTDSERITRLEEAIAQLAQDVAPSTSGGRAARRPAILALIAEQEAK